MNYEEKMKQIKMTKALLDKKFGEGALMRGTAKAQKCETISTGVIPIDLASGVGGFPRGRITEIFADPMLGKSLICQRLVASAQAQGGICAYIDMEHALDGYWATRQGVNMGELEIAQPSSGEEGLQILEALIKTKAFDVIIVDSVAALTPQAIIDGEIGDSTVASQARLMSQALGKINPLIEKSGTVVVFVNQLRSKIGPMANGGSAVSGGRALPYYASMRIELRNMGRLTDTKTGEIYGMTIKAMFMKNKVAPPFKAVEYKLLHGEGIDNEAWLIDYAVRFGFMAKSGAFFYMLDDNGEREEKSFAQGERNAAARLRSEPNFRDILYSKVAQEYNRRIGYFELEEPADDSIEEPVIQEEESNED